MMEIIFLKGQIGMKEAKHNNYNYIVAKLYIEVKGSFIFFDYIHKSTAIDKQMEWNDVTNYHLP